MTQPFTGTVSEKTERSPENSVYWDLKPDGAGLPIHAEPGPAVRELERKRGDGNG